MELMMLKTININSFIKNQQNNGASKINIRPLILGLAATLQIVAPNFAGSGCSKSATTDRKKPTKTYRQPVGVIAPSILDPREPREDRDPMFSDHSSSRPVTAHGTRPPKTKLVRVQPMRVGTELARTTGTRALRLAVSTEETEFTAIRIRANILTAIEIYEREKVAAISCARSESERSAAQLEINAKLAASLKKSLSTIDSAISPTGVGTAKS